MAAQSAEEAGVWMRRMRSAAAYGKVFGVGLEQHLHAAARPHLLPLLVERCIALLRAKALELEGVLRVGGSQKRMDQYRLAFDLLGDAPLASEPDKHTIAGASTYMHTVHAYRHT